jgi:hypothetical protein
MRPLNKSGGRQPAVLWKSRLRGRFGTQSRDTSRATKSGGRQPAVDVVTASATAFVHGRPAGRRCAAIVVLPLQARYTNHGWLTPAAPDARRRCTEKATFAVHNRMFPRAARRQPAVAVRYRTLAAESRVPARTQERRASARRGCGNRVCNGVRARTTSGSPLCGNCGVAATGALHKPRLAYASRS